MPCPPRPDLHLNPPRTPRAATFVGRPFPVPINPNVNAAALELHPDPPPPGWPGFFGPGFAILVTPLILNSRNIASRSVIQPLHIQDIRRFLGHASFIGQFHPAASALRRGGPGPAGPGSRFPAHRVPVAPRVLQNEASALLLRALLNRLRIAPRSGPPHSPSPC